MLEIVKVCPIHGELTLDQVFEDKTKVGFIHKCKQCKKEQSKIYREKNIEKIRSYDRERGKKRRENPQYNAIVRKASREWRQRNADEVNARIRADRKINPEKYLKYDRDGRKRNLSRYQELEIIRKRNISYDEYKWMVEKQNNKCAICGKEETRRSRTKGNICRLTIDHNHNTEKVRELLCHNCNQIIGHCKESIDILKKAILYLERHNVVE